MSKYTDNYMDYEGERWVKLKRAASSIESLELKVKQLEQANELLENKAFNLEQVIIDLGVNNSQDYRGVDDE